MIVTRDMKAAELKPLLKDHASEEKRIDLGSPAFRFTVWVENGTEFSYEDHAQDDHQTTPIIARCLLKDKSRIALLDLAKDRLDVWSMERA
jgi:hypothetical protein